MRIEDTVLMYKSVSSPKQTDHVATTMETTDCIPELPLCALAACSPHSGVSLGFWLFQKVTYRDSHSHSGLLVLILLS